MISCSALGSRAIHLWSSVHITKLSEMSSTLSCIKSYISSSPNTESVVTSIQSCGNLSRPACVHAASFGGKRCILPRKHRFFRCWWLCNSCLPLRRSSLFRIFDEVKIQNGRCSGAIYKKRLHRWSFPLLCGQGQDHSQLLQQCFCLNTKFEIPAECRTTWYAHTAI